jgi:predicted site-specific integrase-resolvase
VPFPPAPAVTEESELMTPAEVRRALRIGQTTLSRYVRDGVLAVVELPGGARRFRRSVIAAILAGGPSTPAPDAA